LDYSGFAARGRPLAAMPFYGGFVMNVLNQNVLVLNQNYEPLSVCSAKRAFLLLFMGKAEMIETYDGYKIRSILRSYPLPSVVRLDRFIKSPRKKILLTRKNIIIRDGGTCSYCGTTKGPMTVDHIIPKNMGGTDSWENMVCACERCNNKKGDRTLAKAGMKLLRKPLRPNHITYIQRFVGVTDDRWKPYLFME
jgi:5-methylcytosine-specific restriction endonuclease McrA